MSTWGHDFRADYKKLGGVVGEAFPGVPITALTATATPRVRDDVMKLLQMRAAKTFEVGPPLAALC